MTTATLLGLHGTRQGTEFRLYDMLISPARNAIHTVFDFEAACAASQDDADADDYLLRQIDDFDSPSPSHEAPTSTPVSRPSRGQKKNLYKKKRRRLLKEQDTDHQAEQSSRHVASCDPVETALETDLLPHPVTGYIGAHDPQHRKALGSTPVLGKTASQCLERCRTLGYTLVRLQPGQSRPFYDTKKRIWGIAVRRKPGQIPTKSIEPLLENIRHRCSHPHHTKRGEFDAHTYGFSYGGGQKTPMNFRNTAANNKILKETLDHPLFDQLLGFGNGILSTWFPRLHGYYSQSLADLTVRLPHLQQASGRIPYGAFTFNVSPQSICGVHRDSCNFATGLCFDEAFGHFNWTLGGHLVLHEPGLVIEMAPGTMVFFPSAVITHQVIPVQPHEQRMSMTGYTAGGLFRFIDQGMTTAPKGKLSKEEKAKQAEDGAERWRNGLRRFMTLEELLDHHSC